MHPVHASDVDAPPADAPSLGALAGMTLAMALVPATLVLVTNYPGFPLGAAGAVLALAARRRLR